MLARSVRASLILENGQVFRGKSFGHVSEAIGEVIFTTANPGYQEIITDPANMGKIVVLTAAAIGNYGINLEDMESAVSRLNGLIIREKCDNPNNWRCEMELAGFLKQQRVMGLEGIDTRSLTITLREQGSMKGIITPRELSMSQIQEKFASFNNRSAVRSCTRTNITQQQGSGIHVAVLDLGMKRSVRDILTKAGYRLTIFPAFTEAGEILACNSDAFFISDGPGLPSYIPQVTETIVQLKNSNKPIFATGLGTLCLAQALCCKIAKLKLGHHSASPVKVLGSGKIILPQQNHDAYIESCPQDVEITHININDATVEGIKKENASGIMFSPEEVRYA